MSDKNLIEIRDLKVHFEITGGLLQRTVGVVKAVDGANLSIRHGEILGLVGESGCGKTTVGRALLRLVEPTAGEVYFKDQNILGLTRTEMKPLRRELQIVFQDPYSSLDPRTRIGDIIGEGLRVHGVSDRDERRERVLKVLKLVGMGEDHIRRFPHEFSGGQRQRIGIARALVLDPSFIVCDEPVSALDVSIQSQVLNLLRDLQQELDLTLLFIAHDMSVVEHLCDRVAVMYLGKIVEVAGRDELFNNPQHPYTQALMSAIPIPNPKMRRERTILEGDVPSPLNPPQGCRFHTRCPEAIDICSEEIPVLTDLRNQHFCACHLRYLKFEPDTGTDVSVTYVMIASTQPMDDDQRHQVFQHALQKLQKNQPIFQRFYEIADSEQADPVMNGVVSESHEGFAAAASQWFCSESGITTDQVALLTNTRIFASSGNARNLATDDEFAWSVFFYFHG